MTERSDETVAAMIFFLIMFVAFPAIMVLGWHLMSWAGR